MSQTILSATYSVVIGASRNVACQDQLDLIITYGPWLGICLVIVSAVAIGLAIVAQNKIIKEWRWIRKWNDQRELTAIESDFGYVAPIGVPLIFFIAWIALLLL